MFVAEWVIGGAFYFAVGVYLAREVDWDLRDRWYRWPALVLTVTVWWLMAVLMLLYTLVFERRD